MSVYVVSYDLRFGDPQDYEKLDAELGKHGVRALESVWFIEVNQTAVELREVIYTYTDRNDRIMVAEIHNLSDWATWHLLPGAARWLSARRP